MSDTLKGKIVRLAHAHPEHRTELLGLLKKASAQERADLLRSAWKIGEPHDLRDIREILGDPAYGVRIKETSEAIQILADNKELIGPAPGDRRAFMYGDYWVRVPRGQGYTISPDEQRDLAKEYGLPRGAKPF
jgi:hypothetical protein